VHRLYNYHSLRNFIRFSSPQGPGSSFRLLTNIPHCCRRQGAFHPLCDWTTFQPNYKYPATNLCEPTWTKNYYLGPM